MAFLDELRQRNNAGGVATPTFGPPQDQSNPVDMANNLLPLYQRRKQIDLQDYQNRENFNTDVGVRRAALQRMFDPTQQQGQQNTVMGADIISPTDKAKLDLEKQKLGHDVESDKAKLGLGEKELALEQQKSNQIYSTKQSDMQRKMDEANQRLQLAHDRLAMDTNNAANHAAFTKAQQDANDARHALDLKQRDDALTEQKRLHDAQIEKMNVEMENLRNPKPVTTDLEQKTIDPNTGKEITETAKKTVTKGSSTAPVDQFKVPDEVQKKITGDAAGEWEYIAKPGGGYTAVPKSGMKTSPKTSTTSKSSTTSTKAK